MIDQSVYTFIWDTLYKCVCVYIHIYGGARGVMDTTQVKILDKADCISWSTFIFGKSTNPIIHPLAMVKQ